MFSFPSINIVVSPLRVVSALAFSISVLSSPHPGARRGIVDGLCDRIGSEGKGNRHGTLRRQESPTERHSKPVEELENEAERNPLLGHVIARATLAVIREAYEAAPENLTSPVLLTACLDGAQPGVVAFLARANPDLVKETGLCVRKDWMFTDNMSDGPLPIHCILRNVLIHGSNHSSGEPAVEDVRALLEIYPESTEVSDPCLGLSSPLAAVLLGQFSCEMSRCVAEMIPPTLGFLSMRIPYNAASNHGVVSRDAFDRDALQAPSAIFRTSRIRSFTFDTNRTLDCTFENLLCMLLLSNTLEELDIQVDSIIATDGGEVKWRRMLASVARIVELGKSRLEKLELVLPQAGGWELADILCRLPRLTKLKVRVPNLTEEACPFLNRVLGGETKIRNITLQLVRCRIDLEPSLRTLRHNQSLDHLHIGFSIASDDSISTWNTLLGNILREDNATLHYVRASQSWVASKGDEKNETITAIDYFTKLNRSGRQIMKSTEGKDPLYVEDFVELLGQVEEDPKATHNDLLMTNAYYWLLKEGLEVWARVASQT